MAHMMEKRQQLIETAFQQFYQYGIHAVGINQILQQAGIAKKTLYSHFASKEALVEAVLAYRDECFYQWLQREMQPCTSLGESIESLFNAMGDWFNNRVPTLSHFNGCFFINTSSEFADQNCTIYQLCKTHKLRIKTLITEHVAASELSEIRQQQLVELLVLLKEGAIVTAQVQGDLQAALTAKNMALLALASFTETDVMK